MTADGNALRGLSASVGAGNAVHARQPPGSVRRAHRGKHREDERERDVVERLAQTDGTTRASGSSARRIDYGSSTRLPKASGTWKFGFAVRGGLHAR